jgi:CBS-domain-containing membrane protein
MPVPHKTKVKEIMVPLTDYPHMPYWFSLKQATTMLRLASAEDEHYKRPPRVVLVFDEKYQLMGLLRKRDILRGFEPRYLGPGPKSADWPKMSSEELCALWADLKASKEAANAQIKEFMVPVKGTVKVDDTITRAACIMLRDEVPVLAVMDGGKVVGIVAIEDVFEAITEAVLAA